MWQLHRNGAPCKYAFKVLSCVPQLNNSQLCLSVLLLLPLWSNLSWVKAARRFGMVLSTRAADFIVLYSVSAASGCRFMLEMSQCQRRKTHSLSCPGLKMFMLSGFAPCISVSFHWNVPPFQVPGDNEKHWKPVLVVLTEKDLLIYESMPRMKEAWFSPLHTYPLLATRYLCFLITATKALGMADQLRSGIVIVHL